MKRPLFFALFLTSQLIELNAASPFATIRFPNDEIELTKDQVYGEKQNQVGTPSHLFNAEGIDKVSNAPWSEAATLQNRIEESGKQCELLPSNG